MALLKRRTAASDVIEVEPSEVLDPSPIGAKGRPTPKRSEARAARPRGGALAPPPKSSGRGERRGRTNEFREAMRSTDISKLPPRERAPERVLTRDFVDTRLNVGPLFLLAFLIYVVGQLVPIGIIRLASVFLMLLGMIAIIADSVILSIQVTRRVEDAYPGTRVRVRAYAIQRALLPRRWRLPKPRVSREFPAP